MAITLAWIVIGALAGLSVMQSVFVWLHCRFVRSTSGNSNNGKSETPLDEEYTPEVAVLLCLRGRDPSLSRCLQGLIGQSYDNFKIHIAVDDSKDLALKDAQSFFQTNNWNRFAVHVIQDHSKHCSLKCSAIVTAALEIDNSAEHDSADVIALVDADAIADPNWLRDLISPLADDTVGAATGNRWFSPPSSSLGSAIRWAWNAAAVPQMTVYEIPWGGSLAIKRSTISSCELLEKWSNAFCEDTMLKNVLKQNGLKVERVPSLILNNDESTTLPGAFHWIVRQMLTVRIHHRDWASVLIHGLFIGLVLILTAIATLTLFAGGEYSMAIGLLTCFLLFELCNFGLLSAVESANLAALEGRGNKVNRTKPTTRLVSILLTQLLHPVAVLNAAFARKVAWRGIEYKILPGKKIQMVKYEPFDDSNSNADSIN